MSLLSTLRPVRIPPVDGLRPVPPGFREPVPPYEKQERDFWCWIACATMVLRTLKLPVEAQCAYAARYGPLKAAQMRACSGPVPTDTNVCLDGTGWPDRILYDGGTACPAHGYVARPLEDAEIAACVQGGSPILAYLEADGGGAHLVMIWDWDATTGHVRLHDPLPSEQGAWGQTYSVESSALRAGHDGLTWRGSYGALRKANAERS